MDPLFQYQDDFASYLHNPYGFATDNEQNAIHYFVRKQKVEKSYQMKSQLQQILTSHFGDSQKIHREGLDKQYKLLRKEVIDENLIGLIIWGTNEIPDDDNSLISTYTTAPDNTGESKKIQLEIKSLCQFLKRDYFSFEEIEKLCQIYKLD